MKPKIVFVGGLTNGLVALKYIANSKLTNIKLIFTHPKEVMLPRKTDISFHTKKKIIYQNNLDKHYSDIKKINPDFIFVVGWPYLISEKILAIPKRGSIGFHPSKLPKDRGRSVLAWQIEDGYRKTALTMFYLKKKVDQGDIIDQHNIRIKKTDYINDILDKVDNATYQLLKKNFKNIISNKIKRKPQKENYSSYRKLRDESNSIINWNCESIKIYNKIRAISKPYPGAIAKIGGTNFKVWRAYILNSHRLENILLTGEFRKIGDCFFVKTMDKILKITNFEKI